MPPRQEPPGRYRVNPKLRCFMDTVVKWSPLLMIVGVIFWSYYAFVFHACLETMTSPQQVVALITYHFVITLFLWSYWKSTTTKPSPVPQEFYIDDDNTAAAMNLPLATRAMVPTQLRSCHHCGLIKPDRCHHCLVCRTCILKMDHHCPWVANCVGYSNYKFFVLFLTYGVIYCVLIVGYTMPYFIEVCRVGWTETKPSSTRNQVVAVFFVGILFACTLIGLWGFHAYLIYRNITTMEHFRAPFFPYGKDKKGFNLGFRRNFRQVFGDDWKRWPFPIFTTKGDGIRFPTRCDTGGVVQPRVPLVSFSRNSVADVSSFQYLDRQLAPVASVSAVTSSLDDDEHQVVPDQEGNLVQVPKAVPQESNSSSVNKNIKAVCANQNPVVLEILQQQNVDPVVYQASGDMEDGELTGVRVDGSRGHHQN